MVKKNKPKYTTDNKLGLAHIIQSPANPTTKEGLEAFREMKKASGMSTNEMIGYIGKKSHFPRQVDNDKKKQETRLEKLSPNE